MTKQRQDFGRAGEKAARAYLKKKGYRILHENFKHAGGEIDLIAEHKKVIVCIEVKSRAGAQFGHPATALTPHKQARIARTARGFLAKYDIRDRDLRFDVVCVTGDPDDPKSFAVELLQDAFRV